MDTPTDRPSFLPQTRPVARHIYWTTLLDNYEPTRASLAGIAPVYAADADGARPETVTLTVNERDMPDAHRALFLLDDGATVRPHYVAGWSPDGRTVHLHPMPTNGGTRPDNGRPVDMSGWQLGPRRAYHLKISTASL